MAGPRERAGRLLRESARPWAFRPQVLRQYALLADGERGAVIGPRGEVAWLCVPCWDSAAVCSELIGGGGVFAVTPRDPRHFWGGWYEQGSLIWHSRWVTTDSVVECREALAYPGERGRAVLLRRVRAVDGTARVRLVLEPRADFGRAPAGQPHHEHGIWTGRTGTVHWRLMGGDGARPRRQPYGRPLVWDLDLREGCHHDLVLELAESPLPDAPPDAGTVWRATETAWADARPALEGAIAPRDAHHAYAVLRGLTGGGGAMVAAATMCLPEQAEGQRNYDYRYAWICDQCYAGLAAAAAGATDLVDAATAFVGARLVEDGPALRPAYTVTGEPVPDERTLDLPGYPGGADRIGNRVHRQFQLDAFGEALQLFAAAARLDRLDSQGERALALAVGGIEHRWTEAEAGIWELAPRHWTQSRLACVAGLRAVAALPGSPRRSAHCAALADTILARTSAEALHPDGYWQRAPGDVRPDAALLLPALEPSCTAVFRADAPELLHGDRDVQRLAGQVRTLAEQLVHHAPKDWTPPHLARAANVQTHCHQHAVLGFDADRELLRRAAIDADVLDVGCCGLAGNFGFERGHHELSLKIAEHGLLPAVRATAHSAFVLADGFSCRTQIDQAGTGRHALHLAEALALGMDGPTASDRPEKAVPRPDENPAQARALTFAVGGALSAAALAAAATRRSTRRRT